jgi:hypothetical protein
LASTRRGGERRLDTQTLLLALESADSTGDWSRFVITDFPQHDPEGTSEHTWERVLLTRHCGEALSRAGVIAEAFGLVPLPAGVLALALVWDSTSGAARSFVATTHEDLVADVQRDILGTDLDGLPELLTTPSRRPVGNGTPEFELDSPRPPQNEVRPQFADAGAGQVLGRVSPQFPLWLLRLFVVMALGGIIFGLATSPAWTFRPQDDLAPPFARPAIAAAIPDDATVSKLLGTEFVRVLDGLPLNDRLFDSMAPLWYDTRTQAIDGARAVQWDSTDGRSKAVVQLAQIKMRGPTTIGTHDCQPETSQKATTDAPVLSAGYISRNEYSAEYCSAAFDKQTQVFVAVLSTDSEVINAMPTGVGEIRASIQHALPSPTFRVLKSFPTPYSTAQLNRGLLLAAIALPLLWALPTLLFDRATWQRLWWTLSLRRFRSRTLPGLDIDDAVRGRLWSAAALSCLQVCVAVWALRLTSSLGTVATGVTVVGTVLAISLVPRLLYLRRVGRSRVFTAAGESCGWSERSSVSQPLASQCS